MLPEKLIYIDPDDIRPGERVSKTFRLDHEKKRVVSDYIDGREAIAQATRRSMEWSSPSSTAGTASWRRRSWR